MTHSIKLLLLSALFLLVATAWLSCSHSETTKPCTVTVLGPNGGESWLRGDSHTITWSSSQGGGMVKLELYQGATPLCTIAASTTDDGSYA